MTDKRRLLSMSDFKNKIEEERDPMFSHLVQHMQDLRQKVPVNYQLKQDLKKQLMEQLRHKKKLEIQVEGERKRRFPFVVGAIILSMLIFIGMYIGTMEDRLHVVELVEVGSFDKIEFTSEGPVAFHPHGEWAILESGGSLVRLNKYGGLEQLFEVEHEGKFRNPTWDPSGNWLAVIYEENGLEQLWLVHPWRQGNRIIYINEGASIASLQWSEHGEWLMVLHQDNLIKKIDRHGLQQLVLHELESIDDIEWREATNQDQLLAQVKWPQKLKEKMDEAQERHIFANDEKSSILLLLEEDEEGENGVEENAQVRIEWLELR